MKIEAELFPKPPPQVRERELEPGERELPLDFSLSPRAPGAPLGTDVGRGTFASADYYYLHLVKAGLIKNREAVGKGLSYREEYGVSVAPYFGYGVAMVPIKVNVKG